MLPVFARHARERGLARFVAGVLGLERALGALEREEKVAVVDELVAGVVRDGVLAGVHADGVAGAGLDAVAAEDAAQLVDDEAHGKALVAAALVAGLVLARLDEDALGGARRGAAEARDAAHAA